ncbi:MAG: type I-E CRISPR-associated protein Cse2/CasB [Planctomycetota bacterium]|nr:type I-E CRISPR-associated protein Cse2/CasB [Planctomycetota bacterium]
MTPTATGQFIQTLEGLKPGDLGQLRKHAGLALDESVDGFDLFAGLWWPLREKNQKAPRREVAWLIAKLYAFCPMPQSGGATLASQLGSLKGTDERAAKRRQQKFDELLSLPLSQIEPALHWALMLIAENGKVLDWVRLTDELSIWEREEIRLKWAKQYLRIEP